MIQHFALEEIEFRYRYRCSPEMAICVMLSRLSAPSRYKEHMQLFQRSRSWLSVVFNDVVIHLITRVRTIRQWILVGTMRRGVPIGTVRRVVLIGNRGLTPFLENVVLNSPWVSALPSVHSVMSFWYMFNLLLVLCCQVIVTMRLSLAEFSC